ncbi:MAG: RseA family anti-sigma factor [Woeseiaceae bacterium]|nr:RseA family anti-sigma factor [Woeseiaceae bacterium]
MNDALKMQISAFIDGELPDNESELLLRRLSQDAEMRQQVSQYLDIGRIMRREHEIPGIDQLRGRIGAVLGEVAEPAADERPVVGSALMTPTAGVAIAATVAALALVGLSQLGAPSDPVLQRAVAIDDGPASYTEPAIEQVLAEQPSERLLQYHARHGDTLPGLGPNGVRTRVISLESSELVEVDPHPHLVSGNAEAEPEQEPGQDTP